MNYRKTLIACYLGSVTQAITANFAPLLFLTFHNVYNIPLGKIALISSVFIISILLMICAGESELSMAQWASAFAESALGLSKAMGDIAGPCLFAVTMGIILNTNKIQEKICAEIQYMQDCRLDFFQILNGV